MKRKVIALILGTMMCTMCLTACGSQKPLESPIIEEETEQVTEGTMNEADEDIELDTEQSELDNSTDENLTEDTEDETESKDNDLDDTESDVDNNESTDNKDNVEDSKDNDEKNEDEDKPVDPYAGLAVAHCHSVTLPMGTSYNDAIAEVTKGTSAYPNTFPNIDGVDFNKPGVYNCFWEQKQEDGTWLPLNYAVFTVTIYDPNPVVTPAPQ